MVRHPGTGRLMWASRLPFGYIESPRLFCALTEAVIARLRKQAAGRGIHFYVFVDDSGQALPARDKKRSEVNRGMIGRLCTEASRYHPRYSRGPSCGCTRHPGACLAKN